MLSLLLTIQNIHLIHNEGNEDCTYIKNCSLTFFKTNVIFILAYYMYSPARQTSPLLKCSITPPKRPLGIKVSGDLKNSGISVPDGH